jgi:hypothetical protein
VAAAYEASYPSSGSTRHRRCSSLHTLASGVSSFPEKQRSLACAAVCALALAGAPAWAQPEQCQPIAERVERSDLAGALALADAARPDRSVERARVILAVATGDHRFLARFRGPAPAVDANTYAPCPLDSQLRMERALAALLPAARERLRTSDLPAVDRAAAEVLSAWAASPALTPAQTVTEIEQATKDFLVRFPDAPYRPFFVRTFLQRYSPARFAFELEAIVGGVDFLGSSGGELEGGLTGGGGLAVTKNHWRVGLRLMGGSPRLRRPLQHDGTTWEQGRSPTWLLAQVAGGYRTTASDRHAALLLVGAGIQQFSLKVDPDHSAALAVAHLSGTLAYEVAFRSSAPRALVQGGRWLQSSLLLRAEVTAFRSGGPSPLRSAGVLVGLGVAGEERWRERARD